MSEEVLLKNDSILIRGGGMYEFQIIKQSRRKCDFILEFFPYLNSMWKIWPLNFRGKTDMPQSGQNVEAGYWY